MVDLKELARGSIGAYLRYITAVAVDGLPTTSERAKKLECEMNVARDAMFNGIADAQAEIARLRGALERLADCAQRCDSWESFPQDELDAAYAAISK